MSAHALIFRGAPRGPSFQCASDSTLRDTLGNQQVFVSLKVGQELLGNSWILTLIFPP